MIGITNARLVFTPSFNLSGGTETYIGNDKLLTFTSNGTLTVTGSGTIRLLIVGAGEPGESGNYWYSGAGGNGGEVYYNSSYSVTEGTYDVFVGLMEGSYVSSIFNITKRRGSNINGIGTAGGARKTSTGDGNNGTNGTSNDITGSTVVYASGGGGGAYSNQARMYNGGTGGTGAGNGAMAYTTAYSPSSGSNYGAGGGGGSFVNTGGKSNGASGKQGVIIIRYTQ